VPISLKSSAEGVKSGPGAVVGVREQVAVGGLNLIDARAHEAGEFKERHLGGDGKGREGVSQGVRRPVIELRKKVRAARNEGIPFAVIARAANLSREWIRRLYAE
jgi:hypothetical protein